MVRNLNILTSFKRRGMASWMKFKSFMQKFGVIAITCFMLNPSKSSITMVPYIFKKRILISFFSFFFFFFKRLYKVWKLESFFPLSNQRNKRETWFPGFSYNLQLFYIDHESDKEHYKLYNYKLYSRLKCRTQSLFRSRIFLLKRTWVSGSSMASSWIK